MHYPVDCEDASKSFSCCSSERLTVQSRPTRVDVSVPPPTDVAAAPVAPRGESRRRTPAAVLAAGPPGFTPASLGNRAPPAA